MANVTFKGKPVTLLGNEVKVGDKAPDFTVLANDLTEVTLADTSGSVRLISVIPSIDTGVCDKQTRRFNEEAAKLPNVKVLTISVDLPFAQSRWCAAAGRTIWWPPGPPSGRDTPGAQRLAEHRVTTL